MAVPNYRNQDQRRWALPELLRCVLFFPMFRFGANVSATRFCNVPLSVCAARFSTVLNCSFDASRDALLVRIEPRLMHQIEVSMSRIQRATAARSARRNLPRARFGSGSWIDRTEI
jgi:hypothetical protein